MASMSAFQAEDERSIRSTRTIPPLRLMARTTVFQAVERGSKPLAVTISSYLRSSDRVF